MRFLLLLIPRTIMYLWYLRQANKWDRKSGGFLWDLSQDFRFRSGDDQRAYEEVLQTGISMFRHTLRRVELPPDAKAHY